MIGHGLITRSRTRLPTLTVDGQARFESAVGFYGPVAFTTSNIQYYDNVRIRLGTDIDFWFIYNSTGTQFELWSTDVDGGGTDGLIYSVPDGTDDIVFGGTVDCGANCEANAYTVGGTAGADFNGAVTNITVVKGIVTVAS